MPHITRITALDVRFPLEQGQGSDAVHAAPVYSYAVTRIETDSKLAGTGLAFTLGAGTDVVCRAIELLREPLLGKDIDELMADWGVMAKQLADHHQLRWLGPHKGVIHLALASLTNACFDLWAKTWDMPLWRLLLELPPEQIVRLLDLSYLEDELTPEQARQILADNQAGREQRFKAIEAGYPGYDTSVGWMSYSEEQLVENARRALEAGFTAMKLKVGSPDPDRDVRRAERVRQTVGEEVRLMFDANQAWSLPQAMAVCPRLAAVDAYWIEEPTHPDDVLGHKRLAEAIAPTALAVGEHLPNRVVFKNYMQAGAVQFIQVDATRVAGVSEFIAVSLLARKFGLKVVPHVGDVGQLHQHLVLFNHIVLGLEKVFLEYIPHLRDRFVYPAEVRDGLYRPPQEPGASCDLILEET